MLNIFTDSKDRDVSIESRRFPPCEKTERDDAFTITTNTGQRVTGNFIKSKAIVNITPRSRGGRIQKEMLPTLTTQNNNVGVLKMGDDYFYIRKLSTRECWRLMILIMIML